MKFNPDFATSTVADLTPSTTAVADGLWWREELPVPGRYGPFYRTTKDEIWDPSREHSSGRWAGPEKPLTKKEAHAMYELSHLDPLLPWKLYTFYIEPTNAVWVFKSKVKGGTSYQIKIPNPVCEFIRIDAVEMLKS